MTEEQMLGRDPDGAIDAKGPARIETEPYFVFRLSRSLYGIHVRHIEQISSVVDATPVPAAPGHFAGVIHLRGTIVAVVDLELALGRTCQSRSPVEEDPNRRMIVLRVCGELFAVEADAVVGVRSVDASTISTADAAPLSTIVVNGVEVAQGTFEVIEGVVLILEADKLQQALSGW